MTQCLVKGKVRKISKVIIKSNKCDHNCKENLSNPHAHTPYHKGIDKIYIIIRKVLISKFTYPRKYTQTRK